LSSPWERFNHHGDSSPFLILMTGLGRNKFNLTINNQL
jgi:hypothetical protein